MNQTTLKAAKRDTGTRGQLRSLRRGGQVPGVIYGKEVHGATPIAVETKELQALLRSNANAVLKLDVEGMGKTNVLLTELQKDALNGEILHADFHQINMNEKITAPVRLDVSGKSAGEKEGGVMQLVLHELQVECLPKDLPDVITLQVENMQVGDSLTLADLQLPHGVTVAAEPDTVLASVLAPQKEISEEEAEAADDKAEEKAAQSESAQMVE